MSALPPYATVETTSYSSVEMFMYLLHNRLLLGKEGGTGKQCFEWSCCARVEVVVASVSPCSLVDGEGLLPLVREHCGVGLLAIAAAEVAPKVLPCHIDMPQPGVSATILRHQRSVKTLSRAQSCVLPPLP